MITFFLLVRYLEMYWPIVFKELDFMSGTCMSHEMKFLPNLQFSMTISDQEQSMTIKKCEIDKLQSKSLAAMSFFLWPIIPKPQ